MGYEIPENHHQDMPIRGNRGPEHEQKQGPRLEPDATVAPGWRDISNEGYREYVFPGGDVVRVDGPAALKVTRAADVSHPVDWDTYFLMMCCTVATRSSDRSTQFGSVIVGPDKEIRSTGYNDFPRGVKSTAERWERPEKYEWVVHAEHNAILNAARIGVSTRGCSLYIAYDCLPCHRCALAIVQAGIAEVVCGHIPFPGKGKGTHYDVESRAEAILAEGGVKVRRVSPRV